MLAPQPRRPRHRTVALIVRQRPALAVVSVIYLVAAACARTPAEAALAVGLLALAALRVGVIMRAGAPHYRANSPRKDQA